MTEKLDIAIIGSGWAGISAAKTCKAYNDSDAGKQTPLRYCVLEASRRIGGRAHSVTLHDYNDIIINPGAQWVHRDVQRLNAPENPLLELARSYGLKTLRDTMPRDFYEQGRTTKWGGNMHVIGQARKMVDRYSGRHDLSLAQLFGERGLGDPLALRTTFGEVETGAPLNEVSTIDVQKLVACNKGDFLLAGVGELVARHGDGIRDHIELGKEVERIRWQPDGVEILTKDGATCVADKCILTVSVGVLKARSIIFEPELPEGFYRQLDHIHMGNFNKAFLVFDPRFKMPVNWNTHMDVRTRNGRDIFYLAHDNGQPLVTAFFGGEMARLCDSSPETVTDLTISGLSDIWGKEVNRYIVHTHVTQWGIDPLVRGGYSRVAVGHHDVRQTLAEPIADKLFLAGEAYGSTHPETGRNWATHMTGAFISGERAAKRVIGQLRENAKDFVIPKTTESKGLQHGR